MNKATKKGASCLHTKVLQEDPVNKQVIRPAYIKHLVPKSNYHRDLNYSYSNLHPSLTIAFLAYYVNLVYQVYLEAKLAYEGKNFTFTMGITITNKLHILHNRAFTYSSPESVLQE